LKTNLNAPLLMAQHQQAPNVTMNAMGPVGQNQQQMQPQGAQPGYNRGMPMQNQFQQQQQQRMRQQMMGNMVRVSHWLRIL
jgi:hypothetical protein